MNASVKPTEPGQSAARADAAAVDATVAAVAGENVTVAGMAVFDAGMAEAGIAAATDTGSAGSTEAETGAAGGTVKPGASRRAAAGAATDAREPAALAQADAEQQARIDLAACYRLAAHFGLNEGIDNHLTVLVPGYSDRFLLAPFGLLWSEVRASDFMVIDFNGQTLSGRGPVEDTALHIHLPVHRLAPQARCALHTHMPYATALGMLEDPRLEMAGQSAVGFYDDIAYEADYNGLALDHTEGERLARALGPKSVLMMRNHGVLVVGQTVAEAFERLYFLERAAMAQVLALSTGRALRRVPEAVVRATAAQFKTGSTVGGRERADLHFDALKRLLDRTAPDYAH